MDEQRIIDAYMQWLDEFVELCKDMERKERKRGMDHWASHWGAEAIGALKARKKLQDIIADLKSSTGHDAP